MCKCNKLIPLTTRRAQQQRENLNFLPWGKFKIHLLLQILSTFIVHAISFFKRCKRCTSCIICFHNPIYSILSLEKRKIARIRCTLPLLGEYVAKSTYKLYFVRLAIAFVNLPFITLRQGCTNFLSVLDNLYVTSSKQTQNISLMKLSFMYQIRRLLYCRWVILRTSISQLHSLYMTHSTQSATYE